MFIKIGLLVDEIIAKNCFSKLHWNLCRSFVTYMRDVRDPIIIHFRKCKFINIILARINWSSWNFPFLVCIMLYKSKRQFCFSVKMKFWVSQDSEKGNFLADHLISAGIMTWHFNGQTIILRNTRVSRSFPFLAIPVSQKIISCFFEKRKMAFCVTLISFPGSV
mgnify:CR=1 FL=1